MTPSLLIGWALVYAGAYVWMGFALGAVLSKTGSQRQVAWVPVKRYVEAARVGDVPTPPVWVARGIALAAWAVFVTFATLRAWDVVAPSPGVKTIASTAFALAVVSSAAAWVAWIVSANRIELRLVAQRRLAWVAAVLPPLWASLIGFGSARPVVVGPVRGADVASPPVVDDATRAIRRVPAPAVQEVEPAPADPEAAEAVEEAMTTDEEDITGKFPRAYSPYDTSAAQAADSSQVQPVEVPPWAYDDDDATFFAKRRRARWALQVVGGEEYDLEDVTTIGREGIRPIPGVLPIVDDTRTVSKLHARLRRESDNWFITDLGSTNGTFVRDAAGNEFEVKAQTEAKVQGTLLLGDLELVIVDLRGES